MGRALFHASVHVVKLGQGLGIQSPRWAGCMAKFAGGRPSSLHGPRSLGALGAGLVPEVYTGAHEGCSPGTLEFKQGLLLWVIDGARLGGHPGSPASGTVLGRHVALQGRPARPFCLTSHDT